MTDIYKKILEPILSFESDDLRKLAFVIENVKPENDDNISYMQRIQVVEVLNRVARLKDFADWIFSDELGEELDELATDAG